MHIDLCRDNFSHILFAAEGVIMLKISKHISAIVKEIIA